MFETAAPPRPELNLSPTLSGTPVHLEVFGFEGFYRCELYPDYCANMSDPLGCLEFYFCGGCSDFSQGFLTCKCGVGSGCDSETE